MSQSADSANTVDAEALVPAQVLRDDEIVLLAVKPSGWFVLLTSWPVLLFALLIAVATHAADRAFGAGTAVSGLYLLCLAAAMIRIVVASFQWLGRAYVLTDRRLMRIRGVIRVDVFQCPLRQVAQTALTATRGEKALGLASLLFQAEGIDTSQAAWLNLSRPEEIRQAVEEAIRRARLGSPGQPPIITDGGK
jgi:hypothetical protein